MPQAKKILLIGPPNAGKTSIYLSIFGYVDPQLVLTTPLEPTMGVDISSFQWKDWEIGIWDLAGQELDGWVGEEAGPIFTECDAMLLIFDVTFPLGEAMNYIKQIQAASAQYGVPHSYIFFHKVDALSNQKALRHRLLRAERQILKKFPKQFNHIYGTSIYSHYFKTLAAIMRQILETITVEVGESAEKLLTADSNLILSPFDNENDLDPRKDDAENFWQD